MIARIALAGAFLAVIEPDTIAAADTATAEAAARRLVTDLASLNLSNAPLTAEQAVWFKAKLADLSALGTNALPAISEFLGRNEDLYFDTANSRDMAGVPSLRVGLFETVGKVQGSNSLSLLKKTFKPRPIPSNWPRWQSYSTAPNRESITRLFSPPRAKRWHWRLRPPGMAATWRRCSRC